MVSSRQRYGVTMRHTLNSTSISAVEETGRGTLIVEFANRGKYEYFDVPQETIQGLLRADSAGRFFNENIRGRFSEEKRS